MQTISALVCILKLNSRYRRRRNAIQVAEGLGIRGIVHNYNDVGQTRDALAAMGLSLG